MGIRLILNLSPSSSENSAAMTPARAVALSADRASQPFSLKQPPNPSIVCRRCAAAVETLMTSGPPGGAGGAGPGGPGGGA